MIGRGASDTGAASRSDLKIEGQPLNSRVLPGAKLYAGGLSAGLSQ